MMSVNVPDLKLLERKAFRLFHQDGLWDMYLGLLLVQIGIEDYFRGDRETAYYLVILCIGLAITWFLYWAGKKWITTPRLGEVRFGQNRRSAKLKMVILLGISVIFNLVLVILTHAAKSRPEMAPFLNVRGSILAIGIGVWISMIMIVLGYFMEHTRGMFYAIFFGGSFTASMLLETPLPFILVGGALTLIGLFYFVRFLQHYPAVDPSSHEQK